MKKTQVVGFDRAGQSWVGETPGRAFAALPPLDGALHIDETTLTEVAQDYGHVRHQRPLAVLHPGSSEDIVRMVNFAREQGIKIGARGQGFSTFGESQAEGGLLLKMSALSRPPIFGPDRVEVSGGMTWHQVLSASLDRGLRPPVLTHNIGLSVGGTLSTSGGTDGGSFRHGAQVDNVLELQVVTGEGSLEICSATRQPELFEAVLCGRGQCAVILSATVRLIPAQTHTLFFELLYPDLETMLDDLRLSVTDGRFDRIFAYAVPAARSGWLYYSQASLNFTPPNLPDRDVVLDGLHHIRGFERISAMSYFECADRGRAHIDILAAQGRGNLHHPFLCLYLPDSTFSEFMAEVLVSLDPSEFEADYPIEICGINPAVCTRPLLRLPDEPNSILIDILNTKSDPSAAEKMVRWNRQFYERARELGGTLNPISAVPMTRWDWQRHYSPYWEQFVSAKRRFDPDNLLAPGPGIF